MEYTPTNYSETFLLYLPEKIDCSVVSEVLDNVSIESVACPTLMDLCRNLYQHDWGGLIVSEDALAEEERRYLQVVLERQEEWSDIPVILLVRPSRVARQENFSDGCNVTFLEYPFERLTFLRTVEVALRSRRRQYSTRTLIEELESSRDAAENANISKSQFLANMSHEIRTPIGAIMGFADLMKNPENSREENLHYTRVVERNSQHLLSLIDDILDLSKVEADKMNIDRLSFSLVDMLVDFSAVMAFKAREKKISFALHFDGAIPERIISDPVRLKQVLTNVVGNAIKFTHVGSVDLTVSYDMKHLVFAVKDTGVGISVNQRERLFKAFSQADTSATRRFGGTGLGLVLSRKLAQVMGGDLELTDSALNEGSTFTVTVEPALEPDVQWVGLEALLLNPIQPKIQTPQKILQNLKVLLVEDSPDNQTLFKLFLKPTGVDLEVVNDGKKGVDRAMEKYFDVILMDIQMPEMDGHEATRKLRDLHYSRPIIAITAHALCEERTRCFQSGFNDYLTKPISKEKLVNALTRYMPYSSTHYPAHEPSALTP